MFPFQISPIYVVLINWDLGSCWQAHMKWLGPMIARIHFSLARNLYASQHCISLFLKWNGAENVWTCIVREHELLNIVMKRVQMANGKIHIALLMRGWLVIPVLYPSKRIF